MTEKEVQMNEETQPVQESTPETQGEPADYKALYLDEVQNAKKLRKRAQDAEKTVQENAKTQETLKVKQMQEKEQYKELYEEVAPYKEKWEAHESKRREVLLSKLPEEDRESLGQKDLDTLEYIVKIKEDAKPVNPEHNPGQTRNVKEPSDAEIWDMPNVERSANWDSIVDRFRKK
tara:strand:- start:2387 stop:2914 length:528 start_codon:yes stop_codon:yes gene_type:complete